MSKADIDIQSLVVVTADRPAILKRCLRSYAAHAQATRPDVRLLVVDDSKDRANCIETERFVAEERDRCGLSLTYLGSASLQAAHKLNRDLGLPRDVPGFLLPLSPPRRLSSPGRARNLALLATAGTPFLMVDDDTVCTVAEHWAKEGGTAFSCGTDPRDTRVFVRRSDALAEPRRVDTSLLSMHETLLGRTLASLEQSGEERADGPCSHLLSPTGTPIDSMVRATSAGLAGDSGVRCPYPLLFSTGDTRAYLASSEHTFRTALTSREIARVAPRNTVTHDPWFMAYCAALDNTTVMPPFSPIGTNEDGLFGALLRISDPRALFGHIPYAIVHDSERQPRYETSEIRSAEEIRFADVVQWFAASWSPEPQASGEPRIVGLGRHLAAAGGLDPRAFHRLLMTYVAAAKSRLLRSVEVTLSSPFEAPPFWRTELETYRRAVLSSVTSPEHFVPSEYRDAASTGAALDELRTDIGSFGRALVGWPALWQAMMTRNTTER